jgi:hypothetical protein
MLRLLNYRDLLPDVEKRKEFNSDLFNYNSEDYLQKKRSDLIGDVSKPESLEEGKREEQVPDYLAYIY